MNLHGQRNLETIIEMRYAETKALTSANPHKQWTISSETVNTGRSKTVIVPPLTW